MRSRLHEMCEFLYLDGADYRELPPNGGVDDLVTLWKTRSKAARKPSLPSRTAGQARAQLRAAANAATARPTSSGVAGAPVPDGRAQCRMRNAQGASQNAENRSEH